MHTSLYFFQFNDFLFISKFISMSNRFLVDHFYHIVNWNSTDYFEKISHVSRMLYSFTLTLIQLISIFLFTFPYRSKFSPMFRKYLDIKLDSVGSALSRCIQLSTTSHKDLRLHDKMKCVIECLSVSRKSV